MTPTRKTKEIVMENKKYEFIVWLQQGAPVRPIIEARNYGEALRIVKAQYPTARSVSMTREIN